MSAAETLPAMSYSISTDEVCGWLDEALMLRGLAAPGNGKANEAVIALPARTSGLSAAELRRRIPARKPS